MPVWVVVVGGGGAPPADCQHTHDPAPPRVTVCAARAPHVRGGRPSVQGNYV